MRWIPLLALCIAVPLMFSTMSGIAAAQDHDQTLQSLLADARAAQSGGDYPHAAEAYRKAVAFDPTIPELWANLGLMDYESGNHSEAISSFQRAIHLNASLFVPQLFLGLEYLQSNKAEAALPHLQTAVKLNPNDPQAIRSLAEAHASLGQIEEALDLDLQAIRLNSNEGSLWFDLGTAYLQQVENDARLMTSVYNDSAYVKFRSAEVLAAEGKLTEAERAYNGAIALAQPLPCGFAELGITLLRQQETSAAQKQFERELHAGDHCGLATLGLAMVDVVSGRDADALDKLAPVANADPAFVGFALPMFRGAVSPEQVKSLIAGAKSRADASSLPDLIASAFSSDEILPGWTDSDANPSAGAEAQSPSSARRLASEGKYSGCNQALRQDPDNESAGQLQLLAYCSFYATDFETTSRAAQKLKKDQATRAQGLYWESRADQNLAVQALDRAGDIDANSPRMHVLLGDVFRQQHHWDEAEAEYRKAIVLDPKSHSARLSLAITL